jgi:hypothetical protein
MKKLMSLMLGLSIALGSFAMFAAGFHRYHQDHREEEGQEGEEGEDHERHHQDELTSFSITGNAA